MREHAVPFEPLDPSEVIWGGRAIARAIGRTTDNPIEPELIVAAIDAAEELALSSSKQAAGFFIEDPTPETWVASQVRGKVRL